LLWLTAYRQGSATVSREDLDRVYGYFPRCRSASTAWPESFSGGEQHRFGLANSGRGADEPAEPCYFLGLSRSLSGCPADPGEGDLLNIIKASQRGEQGMSNPWVEQKCQGGRLEGTAQLRLGS